MKIEHNSQSSLYRSPFGAVSSASKVTVRLSLTDAGIPASVKLCYSFSDIEKSLNMSYVFDACGVCFYESVIEIPEDVGLLYYYFEVIVQETKYFYGNNGDMLGGIGAVYESIPQKRFQITVYNKDFKTPDWWKKSICYQIFPDRFANGCVDGAFLGERNDIIKRTWGDTPFYKPEQFGGEYLANDFFGGNLSGIEKKLPYLAELGISCIYMNPIFKAYSNHRYDTGDYMQIDPILGNTEDFSRLCTSADEFGIKIILDGVFNHTGSDSIYFNKNSKYSSIGAYQSPDSPYFEWYNFSDYPNEYEAWWGIKTLPQVNESAESFQKFILTDKNSVIKTWLKHGASGWRLDVVDELPDFFVRILRQAVKSENPDAVIIGEVWEDASNKVAYGEMRRYFMGDELDGVMNYPLRKALIDFICRKSDATLFHRRIMSLKENYPKEAFYSSFNFLSSHDTERILTVLGEKKCNSKDEEASAKLCDFEKEAAVRRLKCLIFMQFLLPGVPVIFYGDEAGLEGYSDPFCRGCFPWGYEDKKITDFYKEAIRIRNENSAFVLGDFETIYMHEDSYGFIRKNDDSAFIVLVNSGAHNVLRIDAARFGIWELFAIDSDEHHIADDGIFLIDMPDISVKIFKYAYSESSHGG